MAGVDATTGKPLDGFDHVQQSLGKIFTTPQGTRVMREWFGNPGLRLLGEPENDRTVLMWYTVLWMLIELFEPRYRVTQFKVNDLDRMGFGDFTIEGQYRPYAHLDWVQAQSFVSIKDGVVTLGAAG